MKVKLVTLNLQGRFKVKKQYPCYVCDFLATEKGHLRHQQSVHEV